MNYNKTIRNQGYSVNAPSAKTSDAWTNNDCYDHTDTIDTIDDCGFWATDNDVDDIDDCMFFNTQS